MDALYAALVVALAWQLSNAAPAPLLSTQAKPAQLSTFRCSPCAPGYGVSSPCSQSRDTLCKPCGAGFHSDLWSSTHPCHLCSLCGTWLYELHPCNATNDVFCELCAWSSKNTNNNNEPNPDFQLKCSTRGQDENPAGSLKYGLLAKRRKNFFGVYEKTLELPNDEAVELPPGSSENQVDNDDMEVDEWEVAIVSKINTEEPGMNEVTTKGEVIIVGNDNLQKDISKAKPIVATSPKGEGIQEESSKDGLKEQLEDLNSLTEEVVDEPDLHMTPDAIISVSGSSVDEGSGEVSPLEEGSGEVSALEERSKAVEFTDRVQGPTKHPHLVHIEHVGKEENENEGKDEKEKEEEVAKEEQTKMGNGENREEETKDGKKGGEEERKEQTEQEAKKGKEEKEKHGEQQEKEEKGEEEKDKEEIREVQSVAETAKEKKQEETKEVLVAASNVDGNSENPEVAASKEDGVGSFSIIIAIITAGLICFILGFFINRYRSSSTSKHQVFTPEPLSMKPVYAPTPTQPPADDVDSKPAPCKAVTPQIIYTSHEEPDKKGAPPDVILQPPPSANKRQQQVRKSMPPIGKYQSPIDINPEDAELSDDLENSHLVFKYVPENTKSLINLGNTVKVMVDCRGSDLHGGPLGDDRRYCLDHFRFLWGADDTRGSEHSVAGKRYAGEIQFVHWNKEDFRTYSEASRYETGLAIISVFLNVTEEQHASLQTLLDVFKSIQYKGESVEVPHHYFDPSSLLPGNILEYWTYPGSLTEAPYAETVTWLVMKEPISVSAPQMAQLRELLRCERDEMHGMPGDERLVDNFREQAALGDRNLKASFH